MDVSPRSLILDLLSTLRRGSMPVRALVRAGWRTVVGFTFARALTYGARLDAVPQHAT